MRFHTLVGACTIVLSGMCADWGRRFKSAATSLWRACSSSPWHIWGSILKWPLLKQSYKGCVLSGANISIPPPRPPGGLVRPMGYPGFSTPVGACVPLEMCAASGSHRILSWANVASPPPRASGGPVCQVHGLSGVLYSSGDLYNSPIRDVCCLGWSGQPQLGRHFKYAVMSLWSACWSAPWAI